MRIVAIVFLLLSVVQAHADERVLSEKMALEMGFKKFESFRHPKGSPAEADLPRNLPWPVNVHTIAQNYVEFQDYGTGSYFHKGDDLLTDPESWVAAPVSGILEGGYYSYVTNPDGSEKKYWTPWNGQVHSDPYFELALVTDDGYRIELHHVDSMNLPENTVSALNKGGVRIESGTQIGHVIPWGMGYDHIHYNIFRSDKTILNPEYYSISLADDQIAPTIHSVVGIPHQGGPIEIKSGTAIGPIDELVVAATDTRNSSSGKVQTPPYVSILFDSGYLFSWNFREQLTNSSGVWPDIRLVFAPTISLPGGQNLQTYGNYGDGMFLFRMPVAGKAGHYKIEVRDSSENSSSFEGAIGL